jgi:hypothetical protein
MTAVEQLCGATLRRGNGVALQRATHARTGCLRDVVAEAMRRTLSS